MKIIDVSLKLYSFLFYIIIQFCIYIEYFMLYYKLKTFFEQSTQWKIVGFRFTTWKYFRIIKTNTSNIFKIIKVIVNDILKIVFTHLNTKINIAIF